MHRVLTRHPWAYLESSNMSHSIRVPYVMTQLEINLHNSKFHFTSVEQVQIRRNYHAIAGLPSIIGAIDCTLVPSPDAFPFLNRRQHQPVNIRIISASKHNLLKVVARWPGGAHDSYGSLFHLLLNCIRHHLSAREKAVSRSVRL
ncbi:hypothetical protein F2P81_003791 [Scophthalmus maximus]|uniref:DDE Tnp4 domain-containing protein n=1 Tax=Scophthalmus maximus TaxID=52904 RepID=A0A6A4TF55_SCOMX|nr:hypothetical protein F2P81_003791 [Scophthalmus maximus]